MVVHIAPRRGVVTGLHPYVAVVARLVLGYDVYDHADGIGAIEHRAAAFYLHFLDVAQGYARKVERLAHTALAFAVYQYEYAGAYAVALYVNVGAGRALRYLHTRNETL